VLTGGFIPAAAQSNAFNSNLDAEVGADTIDFSSMSNLDSSVMGVASAASRWSRNSDDDILALNANAKLGSELTGTSSTCFFANATQSVSVPYAEGVSGGVEVEGAATTAAGAGIASLAGGGTASLVGTGEKLKDDGAIVPNGAGVDVDPNGEGVIIETADEVDACARENGVDVSAKGDAADVDTKEDGADVNAKGDGIVVCTRLDGVEVDAKGNGAGVDVKGDGAEADAKGDVADVNAKGDGVVGCAKVEGAEVNVNGDGTEVCAKGEGADTDAKGDGETVCAKGDGEDIDAKGDGAKIDVKGDCVDVCSKGDGADVDAKVVGASGIDVCANADTVDEALPTSAGFSGGLGGVSGWKLCRRGEGSLGVLWKRVVATLLNGPANIGLFVSCCWVWVCCDSVPLSSSITSISWLTLSVAASMSISSLSAPICALGSSSNSS